MLFNRFTFLLLVVTSGAVYIEKTLNLQTVTGWTYLQFPVQNYTRENCITTGITVTRDGFVFAVPRFKTGVPTTLAWLPRTKYIPQRDPLLIPFPSLEWQHGHENGCRGLVSVFRTRLDTCGRLWTVDSGWYNGTRVCPPKLLVFNVDNGRLIKSVTFPSEVLRPESLLTFLVLDDEGTRGCDPSFVYITDAIGFGLVVYDVVREVAWRLEHETFRHDPRYATVTIQGETTKTDDGIIALALARLGSRDRALFYHALAGIDVFAIPTRALRNPPRPGFHLPVVHVFRKSSPGVGMTSKCHFDTCTIFVSPLADTAVDTWNPQTPTIIRRLVSDPRRLQYISDMTVSEGALWLVSNRFHSFDNATYDPHSVNLRFLRLPLS